MIALMIYLFTVLGTINTFFAWTTGLLVAGLILVGIIFMTIGADSNFDFDKAREEPDWLTFMKWIKRAVHFLMFSVSMNVLLPTEKTMAAMYLVPKLVENQEVQKIPDNLLKILNLNMEAWVNDLTEDVAGKVDAVKTKVDTIYVKTKE